MNEEMVMSEKKKSFLQDVMHELQQLKTHTTYEEKALLDLDTFSSKAMDKCIYGQMTGNCCSERAKQLMNLSCIRVLDVEGGVEDIDKSDIDDERFRINGEYSGQTWIKVGFHDRYFRYLSALEGYIATTGANIKGIMAYLKGETETVQL